MDKLVGQLLFQSVKKNKIADGYVTQTVHDPWRKTWSYIYQYYMPTGNNAMATQSSRVGALWRREDESCRSFIKRLDSENAVLKSLGGVKEDYVLNNVLLGSVDPEYKPLVIIGIENKESYETVRDMLLRAMPHPAQGGGKKNKQARAMATIANANSNQNQSGGKKKSKTKNSIKNLNAKFQNFGGGDVERCKRCNNLGHNHKSCRADLSKKCSFCQKFGHLANECRSAGKSQSSGHGQGPPVNTVSYSSPPVAVQTPSGQMYLVDAATYHANMALSINSNSNSNSSSSFLASAPTELKPAIRTVTLPSNFGSRAINAPGSG